MSAATRQSIRDASHHDRTRLERSQEQIENEFDPANQACLALSSG
jgi:hypothetical protein